MCAQFAFFILYLLLAVHVFGFLPQGSLTNTYCASRHVLHSSSKVSFLADPSEEIYVAAIQRRTREALSSALSSTSVLTPQLLEVEFPPARSSDPSVSATLDRTRAFTRELIKEQTFTNLGKDCWIVFPDRKEAALALRSFTSKSEMEEADKFPFTLTSTDSILAGNMQSSPPKVMIFVSPGFNIPEYLDLEKAALMHTQASVIVINGNLDRLRNGYYPSFFYPQLTQASKRYYSRFTQTLILSPVALNGDRFGGWVVRLGATAPWELYVRMKASTGTAATLERVSSFDREPVGQEAWKLASAASKKASGRMF